MYLRTPLLILLLLIGSTFLGGCLLFSPYASPVVKPLVKGEVEVAAGAGVLPRFFSEEEHDVGLEGGVHFSPVDRLMIGARLWSSIDAWDDDGFNVDGYGLDASLLLADPERTDILRLAPTLHLQYGSHTDTFMGFFGHPGPGTDDTVTTIVSGIGYGLGLNAWTPAIGDLHPVVGLSARRHTFSVDDSEGNTAEESSSVMTVGLHGGLGYELTDNLNVSAEVVLHYEHPEDAETRDNLDRSIILTPMIRAAWRF